MHLGSTPVMLEPSPALPLVHVSASLRVGALEDPEGKELSLIHI